VHYSAKCFDFVDGKPLTAGVPLLREESGSPGGLLTFDVIGCGNHSCLPSRLKVPFKTEFGEGSTAVFDAMLFAGGGI
jgi:hypothetical protein